MSKDLLFIVDDADSALMDKYLADDRKAKSFSALITDIAGLPIAEKYDLFWNSYENIGWTKDRAHAANTSARLALEWMDAADAQDTLAPIREFNGFPLLYMHYSLLRIGLRMALEAREFMRDVLLCEQPTRVLSRWQEDCFPQEEYALGVIMSGGELERMALKSLCDNMDISFQKYHKSTLIRDSGLEYSYACGDNKSLDFTSINKPNGKTILMFTWGGYHFGENLGAINTLHDKGYHVVVVFSGEINEEHRVAVSDKNITLINKYEIPIGNAEQLFMDWVAKGEYASRTLGSSKDLARLFSDEIGSYYKDLILPLIRREFVKVMPATVLTLARCEALVKSLNPDMVFSHFSIHPCESAQVLPARKAGIPTLTSAHGVNSFYNYVFADTFSTEHYAAWGETTRFMLDRAYDLGSEKLRTVGTPRLESLSVAKVNRQDLKRKFGFDPERPLCLFCDVSSFPTIRCWRNTTPGTVAGIANLGNTIPELQVVYRVHHGSPCKEIQHVLEQQTAEVHFQDSWSVTLTDILPAADLVIAHNPSSCAEALLCGIPVIYLSALSDVEPLLLGYEAITHVSSFSSLTCAVRNILKADVSPEVVRKTAQPFFDDNLDGVSGQSTYKLVEYIAELADRGSDASRADFSDWVDRIHTAAASHYESMQLQGGKNNLYKLWIEHKTSMYTR